MPTLVSRLIRAMPDAVTGGFFLFLWLDPLRFGTHGVRNGMLMMLVEFILIHASAFLGSTAMTTATSRGKKFKTLAGFSLFYLIFIVVWSWAFKEWWPFLAFGWLLFAKLAIVLDGRRLPAERLHRMQSDQALTTMAYLGGVFLTVFLPVPRLGITVGIQPMLDLPGSGMWVNEPHTVIAFGTLYFASLAAFKWCDTTLPASSLPRMKDRA